MASETRLMEKKEYIVLSPVPVAARGLCLALAYSTRRGP